MPAERVTLHRTNVDKTEVIEQYPKTISGQVYDIETEKFLDATIQDISEEIEQSKNRLNSIAIYIKDFPRLQGESTDTLRFRRALASLSASGGGELLLDSEEYIFDDSITITKNVFIVGKGQGSISATQNITLLTYSGSGKFITIDSYYNERGGIKNLNIRCNDGLVRNSPTTAIEVLYNNTWGGSSIIDKVNIYRFGTGVMHKRTWQNTINNCVISECGVGVEFNAYIAGVEPIFGNVNVVEHTVIFQCDIGVKALTDTLNIVRNCDIEKCYIAVQSYQVNGYLPTQQMRFENCWFERNGWKNDADRANNTNPRYFYANSIIDSNFLATGVNSISLITDRIEFSNCRYDDNVTPQIPSFNANYQIYQVEESKRVTRRYALSDTETARAFFNRDEILFDRRVIGSNQPKELLKISNKGLNVKLGFNYFEARQIYTETISVSRTIPINYSSIVNPNQQGSGIINEFSSTATINIGIRHHDGYTNNRVYLLNDFVRYSDLSVIPLADVTNRGNHITSCEINNIRGGGDTDKMFDVVVQGDQIRDISVKINFLPNGLSI